MNSSSSQRRNARMRREYLYTRDIASRSADSQLTAAKESLKRTLTQQATSSSNKKIASEIRSDYDEANNDLALDDDITGSKTALIDDEYALCGLLPPKVCVTTSRSPSSRLKQFAKELNLVIPNAKRINRGGTTVKDLVDACKRSEFTDMVLVQETRGEPDGLVVCHLPNGPTAFFSLSGSVMRHDIEGGVGSMSEAIPHIITEGFESDLGKRTATVLKCLFPSGSKEDTKRVITFRNEGDFISFRHHTWSKLKRDEVKLKEVGPRFEMRLYNLRLGTLDQKDAETEFVLRPYQNTANKRKKL
ncbi:hypothetical protein ScalyP_jg5161 [Parmales sp. scaly parma]|nr:hypothetical protein ScalyP_jg5161 [Parmales sp. scaly parma]